MHAIDGWPTITHERPGRWSRSLFCKSYKDVHAGIYTQPMIMVDVVSNTFEQVRCPVWRIAVLWEMNVARLEHFATKVPTFAQSIHGTIIHPSLCMFWSCLCPLVSGRLLLRLFTPSCSFQQRPPALPVLHSYHVLDLRSAIDPASMSDILPSPNSSVRH